MLKPFYQPRVNGVPTRCFGTKQAAVRFCRRLVKRDGGIAQLFRFVSPSQPGELIDTFSHCGAAS